MRIFVVVIVVVVFCLFLGFVCFLLLIFVVVTVHCTFNTIWIIYPLSKEEGKYQEMIHSSTTRDP